jgi:subfamily B ATP-binding cassette protein HlyB/CyaB
MTSSCPPPLQPLQGLDTGLVCLLIIARYFGLPAVADQLAHQFGTSDNPFSDVEILRAAKSLGLKAGKMTTQWSQLSATPLPAVAPCKDGRYDVLAKIEGERVLAPGSPRSTPAVALTHPV